MPLTGNALWNHPYTEVFEDVDPETLKEDDLVHVEVDPEGVSHIYSTLNLPSRNHVYHPEWDEFWDQAQ